MAFGLPLAHQPRLRIAIIAAVVVGLLALWWRGDGGDGVSYRTAEVGRGPIQLLISATGNLKALSTVEVSSQVSGQVLTVNVDFNDRVKKGEVIATIDPARSEEHTSELQSLMRISYAVFCLKK